MGWWCGCSSPFGHRCWWLWQLLLLSGSLLCALIIGWLCIVHGEWALWAFVFVGSCCGRSCLWVIVVGICVLGGSLVVAVGSWCGRLSLCVARGHGPSLSLSCACRVLGSGCGCGSLLWAFVPILVHWRSLVALWAVIAGCHCGVLALVRVIVVVC